MIAQRLKTFMPRSLYGRAALILLVPILSIILVVSVVFIQRLYDEVTRQMTEAVVTDLEYLLAEVAEDPTRAELIFEDVAAPLGFRVQLSDASVEDRREWIDLTGRIVTDTLRDSFPSIRGVDLTSQAGTVTLGIDTAAGPAEVNFPRRRVSARNPHQLLVLMGFTALFMTLVAFLYLRGQIRPIKRLAVAAEAFGKGQSVRYKPTGAIEVRAAGSAFLDMRARIERQIEQRTTMLSGVSHDLRTPLTRMKLTLSLMEPSEDVDELTRDVEDMERMLKSFLSFARGDALDDPEDVDPVELVQAAVKRAIRGGVAAEVGQIKGKGRATLRPMAIGRALDNLLGNAGRYGKKAKVGLTITERAITIQVEDDGPGIAEDELETALKPFQRLDKARNQDSGSGVGLGLAITADIARSHGGALRLGRSPDMGGLSAELILPRSGSFDLGTENAV